MRLNNIFILCFILIGAISITATEMQISEGPKKEIRSIKDDYLFMGESLDFSGSADDLYFLGRDLDFSGTCDFWRRFFQDSL